MRARIPDIGSLPQWPSFVLNNFGSELLRIGHSPPDRRVPSAAVAADVNFADTWGAAGGRLSRSVHSPRRVDLQARFCV